MTPAPYFRQSRGEYTPPRVTRLLALVATLAGCRGSGADSGDATRCRALGDGNLRGGGVTVHLASGTVPACEHNAAATRAFIAAREAFDAIPHGARPERVVVHISPGVDTIETDREAGMIRVSDAPKRSVERAAWLHEIAHIAALGPRPKGIIGGRLADALDEAVADYYAAAVLATPKLGPRDLSEKPRAAGAAWSALPMPAAKFDPHPLGHALATELWKRRVQLVDLVICMQAPAGWGETDAPRAVLGAWLSGCPERSRATIREAVAAWAPEPMLPAEREAHIEEEAEVVR